MDHFPCKMYIFIYLILTFLSVVHKYASWISSLDLLRICVYLELRISTLGLNPRYEFLIAFKIIYINLSLIVRNIHMPPVSFNWVNSPVCAQLWTFGDIINNQIT